MRWRMCPKCGIKMSMEISETDLRIYHCNVCKQKFMELQGELLKYIEREASKNNMNVQQYMDDMFKVLDDMERRTNGQAV